MRKVVLLLVGSCLVASGMMAVGCGSSNHSSGPPANGDSGLDSSSPTPEAAAGEDGNPGPEAGGDAGGCTFAGFVLGLIDSSTNATSQPSTNLGQNCTDDHDAADFAPLFQ
jgi:hypothetical protein